MTTYVLIPGACHGAWCFDDLADRAAVAAATGCWLHADRCRRARAPAHAGVNLETHITDVLSALAAEPDAEDLVLVGHSYGGMVITGGRRSRSRKGRRAGVSRRAGAP